MIANKKFVLGAIAAAATVVTLVLSPMLVENVDAGNITVIQSPVSGDLTVYFDGGWKWQGFGKVTTYPRRDIFDFSIKKAEGADKAVPGDESDKSIPTRFNDGGNGSISGTMNWQMPLKADSVIALHKDFGSVAAIEQQLIRTAMQKVVYNVGPTMSSTESSAEKRPEIPKYVDDQLIHGPYLTKTVQMIQQDPVTGKDKQVAVVQIAMSDNGQPLRESKSQITEYGIMLQPVSINQIRYNKIVEDQIAQRQIATTQVQISIANARKAEQEAITTEQQGKANAAKAKWEQEVENAKTIADAQAKIIIADANVKEAEAFKKSETLRGEGEAARKRLVMEADGQLDKKLEAIVKINSLYADAIKSAQPGAWSPSVVMGGSSGTNGGQNASTLVDLMTAKTAKEIGLDLSVRTGKK